MSQLPPQAIDEFQLLWKKHFNEELPQSEAATRAHQTFTVLRMLIEPFPTKAPLVKDDTHLTESDSPSNQSTS